MGNSADRYIKRDMRTIKRLRKKYGDKIQFHIGAHALHLENLEEIPDPIYKMKSVICIFMENVPKIDLSHFPYLYFIEPIGPSEPLEIPETVKSVSFRKASEIPEWIVSGQSIETLRVRDSQITSFPEYVADLPNLDYVVVENTALTSIPRMLTKLPIKELEIKHSQIREVPDWVDEFVYLEKLDLSDNPIKNVSPNLYKIPNLRNLDLSYTLIEELPEGIGNMKQIKYIYIDNTKLKAFPSDIGNLPPIHFSFDNIPVEELPPLNLDGAHAILLDEAPLKYPLDWKHDLDWLQNHKIIVPDWWDMEEVHVQCRILGVNPKVFTK